MAEERASYPSLHRENVIHKFLFTMGLRNTMQEKKLVLALGMLLTTSRDRLAGQEHSQQRTRP